MTWLRWNRSEGFQILDWRTQGLDGMEADRRLFQILAVHKRDMLLAPTPTHLQVLLIPLGVGVERMDQHAQVDGDRDVLFVRNIPSRLLGRSTVFCSDKEGNIGSRSGIPKRPCTGMLRRADRTR